MLQPGNDPLVDYVPFDLATDLHRRREHAALRAAAVRFLAVYAAYDRDEWAGGPRVTCPPVDPLEAAADTFFTALVFTDADTDPTVDAAHLLGRIQGRELAERETPAEGAVLNESSAG